MLKKTVFIIVAISVLFSCTKSVPKNYAILSGKIKNAQTKEITIKNRQGVFKKIKINKDGSFKDTLHLKQQGQLFVFSTKETGQVFLKNNDNISLSVDETQFNETLQFSGNGAETSNYLAKKIQLQNKFAIADLFNLDKNAFASKTKEITGALKRLLEKSNNIDTAFYSEEQKK